MYSSRQRDVRERRAQQEWDVPRTFDQESALDTDDARELETPSSWGIQLNARASAA